MQQDNYKLKPDFLKIFLSPSLIEEGRPPTKIFLVLKSFSGAAPLGIVRFISTYYFNNSIDLISTKPGTYISLWERQAMLRVYRVIGP